MQKLRENHRSPTVDRALRFFVRRARARPETAQLAQDAAERRTRLRQKRDAYEDALDERTALSAEVAYLDVCIDRLVLVGLKRDLGAMTAPLSKADGAALERKLFQGVAPSAGMKPIAGEDQEHYVKGIVDRLENDADYAPLQGHGKKIAKAQKDIDKTITRRKEARVQERLAQGNLEDETESGRRFYNQLHPRLQLLFPDDPALVESYFLDLRRVATEEKEEGGEGGEGGGGEG